MSDQRTFTRVVMVVHGKYGQPLLEIAEKIAGPMNVELVEITPDSSSPDLTRRIIEEIGKQADTGEPVLFLSDLGGSTPANACLYLLGNHQDWEMISGVNLAMLLKLSTCPRTMLPAQLARELRETGQRSIRSCREMMAIGNE